MSHLHIDDFSHDVARILMHCYLQFPRPCAVYVEDICGPTEVDDVGLHSPRHMACLGAMLWLADEGFLRYQNTIFQEGIEQAVLTNRAFIQLTALCDVQFSPPDPNLPHTIQKQQATLAEQLLGTIRNQDSERTQALVRYLLSRHPQPVPVEEFEGLLGREQSC